MGYEKKVMRVGRDARVESGENKGIGFRKKRSMPTDDCNRVRKNQITDLA
jgi:hypothetical protein